MTPNQNPKVSSTEQDYTIMSKYHNREVRHYVFVLKNTEYSEKKVATTISMNASTELKLWLGESGNVIGLDFVQVLENTNESN